MGDAKGPLFAMARAAGAVMLAGLALVAVLMLTNNETSYGDDSNPSVLESVNAAMRTADGKKVIHVKGETAIRHKIKKALRVARHSLGMAHGHKQKTAAKAAVKAALADAGIADADSAGTIAWAGRNLDAAKKWSDHALKRDAKSLGKVAAWKVGDRKQGILMRRKCERAVQSMIAVASATKNKEMVAKEDKLRAAGK